MVWRFRSSRARKRERRVKPSISGMLRSVITTSMSGVLFQALEGFVPVEGEHELVLVLANLTTEALSNQEFDVGFVVDDPGGESP